MTIVRPADPVTAPARRAQLRKLLREMTARLEAEQRAAEGGSEGVEDLGPSVQHKALVIVQAADGVMLDRDNG